MIRDLDRLASHTFDVLVVGGGIYGLTIAYDAAQRGLSVALIERDDFGSGTSFNHLRTIHGGLRYLQKLDFARARESVRERRAMARIAPHSVRPVPFASPSTVRHERPAMRAGVLPIGSWPPAAAASPLASSACGPRHSRGNAVQNFPGLRRQGLTGAAVIPTTSP